MDPEIVTATPGGALAGEKPEICGGLGVTVKLELLVTDSPFDAVTVIGPVTAPEGTAQTICVEVALFNEACTLLLNFTTGNVVRFVPLIVT